MCSGCWHGFGAPQIVNDGVLRARAAITALYVKHGAGGGLHVVVDDWNLEDDNVAWCGRYLDKEGGDELERNAFATLEPLTIAERASALALERGYFK